ncbi:MAG TPA: dihydroorotase family protein [Acidimicrobiia bacterium]
MRTITIMGGTVVTASSQTRADLRIEQGKIAAIGEVEPGDEIVDAGGLLVMPGMVDTHVHLMDPGASEREDFVTGTSAAAARGVTTIVEHTHAHPIRTVTELVEKRQHLVGRANVDYGLAAHVWPDRIGEIPDLAREGIVFFKIFTCNTHGVPGLEADRLASALGVLGETGARCLIHNEDETMTHYAELRLRADGRVDPGLLLEWRSRDAELVAVAATAAALVGTRAVATFAHVSHPGVLDIIDEFRRLGADIAAEACPQYFAMDEAEVTEAGALRKFTPPARIRDAGDRSAMWRAVEEGRFSHFSTDHAPSTLAQKQTPDFWEAPFGLPGLDTTLPFLIDAALSGRITMSDVVRLYTTAPANRYRLRKGVIEIGADADLVLVDPEGSWKVRNEDVISKAGWSPFAGKTFRGRVMTVYLRGEEIARDGRCHDLRTGRWIGATI